jgi:decaprenylphospho-beta-D-erythro-pentofuranosid-2-ulose 2-reductase
MVDAAGRLQRVLLLGGTSEIGRAILHAVVLAPDAEVILAGRDEVALLAVAASLPSHLKPRVDLFDALEPETARAVVERAFESGAVDLVVPAFGVLGDQPAFEDDPLAAVPLLAVNVTAQTVVLLEAARGLRRQGHGTLLVLSSVAAVRARRPNFVYGSGKAALEGMAVGLDAVLSGSGARVIVVRPGFVVGRMTRGLRPAPLACTPADVGAAVAGALGRAPGRNRRIVWVPGRLRVVSWLMRLTPRVLWVRLRR